MARAGRSYVVSGPREVKEHKTQKLKRIEENRKAKAQAKKFVIPGMIAVVLCMFFLFVAMYGFKGRRHDNYKVAIENAARKYSSFDTESARGKTTNIVMQSLNNDNEEVA
ncbi:hypothetical protein BGZ49_003042 [Haplosporangium sp. Z 27]|nr:hypothetical protein BGZ49_003042 [Haplosporangium sp. Z 27]